MSLPAEIWVQIFNLAADEDVIFQYGLPTVMAESAWVKNVFDKWSLRRPSEALNVVQRRSYTTKKVHSIYFFYAAALSGLSRAYTFVQ
jgi:hypothetical protein